MLKEDNDFENKKFITRSQLEAWEDGELDEYPTAVSLREICENEINSNLKASK